jgi:anti-sigma regulatory factor (Ser/Thr protein kinase)
VTEACSNTVRHAYPDQPGTIDMEMALPQSHTLEVVVVDAGVGVDARTADPGAGFGLKLMETFSRLTVRSDGRGTRVEMQFPCQARGAHRAG